LVAVREEVGEKLFVLMSDGPSDDAREHVAHSHRADPTPRLAKAQKGGTVDVRASRLRDAMARLKATHGRCELGKELRDVQAVCIEEKDLKELNPPSRRTCC